MSEPYQGPAVGKMAPAFKLPACDGQTISLSDFKGKQNVVLYFYPKADTPGCTKEACGFRDAILRREYDDAAFVLGISPDPIEKGRKFASKCNLHFLLED